jgi:hypothetical protein
VRRLILTLASVALLAASGSLPLLHIHVYAEHDHPSHHHGPAFHTHGHATNDHHRPGDPPVARFAPCEADAHVLSLTAVAATPIPQSVEVEAAPLAPFVLTPVPAPPLQARDEVRAHSPPGLTDSPLRAPPPSHPA